MYMSNMYHKNVTLIFLLTDVDHQAYPLTHCGLVMLYDNMSQQRLRYCLIAWLHQVITWTTVAFSSVRICTIHVRTISQWVPGTILYVFLKKMIPVKSQPKISMNVMSNMHFTIVWSVNTDPWHTELSYYCCWWPTSVFVLLLRSGCASVTWPVIMARIISDLTVSFHTATHYYKISLSFHRTVFCMTPTKTHMLISIYIDGHATGCLKRSVPFLNLDTTSLSYIPSQDIGHINCSKTRLFWLFNSRQTIPRHCVKCISEL